MNLKRIHEAIKAYRPRLDEDDRARLEFFAGVWGAQDACEQRWRDRLAPYELPDEAALRACYEAQQPVFLLYPRDISAEALADAASSITEVLLDGGDYPDEVADGLAAVAWDELFAKCGVAEAGRDPSAWLIDVEAALGGGAEGDEATMPDTAAFVGRLGALVASLALKIQLIEPAARILKALDGGAEPPHPTLCPVCGSSPMLAHVGGPSSTDGRGRVLVCPQCAAVWEFDRVRCARCGTRHESALHYYHIEGDDSHRIATCDECGGYIRTLFSERELLPVAYEVEDVVMARLDAIAARALETPSERVH